MIELLNTKEVAEYLRIKERKVYELLKEKRIPASRVTGKWLFDKTMIDAWLLQGTEGAPVGVSAVGPRPAIVAGSADPLLEWALRESDCGLALNAGGSLDGLSRFVAGEALACGMHVRDVDGGYNVAAVRDAGAASDAVLIHWAVREQGLVLASGNPLNIKSISDLDSKNVRFVLRQPGAGSRILFESLAVEAGIDVDGIAQSASLARSETDLGLAIAEGKADAGVGVADVARQYRLDFIPLVREQYGLLVSRPDYFDPAFQELLAFTRSDTFAARASEMAGYDVSGLGRVVLNGE